MYAGMIGTASQRRSRFQEPDGGTGTPLREESKVIKSFRAVLALALVWACSPSSQAAVYLSGDGNILDALDGSAGNPYYDAGNVQFFRNVLGAGSHVAVLQNTSPLCCESFDEQVSAFYDSLPGVTATTIVGTVDAAALAGANLFVSAIPDDAFSSAETAALRSFVQAGGTVFFLGENEGFPANNAYINDAMAALGVDLRIAGSDDTGGYLSVGPANILADPATAGVTSFTYAAGSVVAGGKPLVLNQAGNPEVAVSSVPLPGALIFALSGGMVLLPRSRKC